MEPYAHGAGAFWLNLTVDVAFSCRVVNLMGLGGLGVSHFLQDIEYFNSFACIDIKCCKFGIGSREHYCVDDF